MAMTTLGRIINTQYEKGLPAEGQPKTAKYLLIGPNGERVSAPTLSDFCREQFGVTAHGKPRYLSSFSDMVLGVRSSNNVCGWTVSTI